MRSNQSVTLVHANDHPVLDRPLSWRVQDVRLTLAEAGVAIVRVVLVISRETRRRELRFDGVVDFTLAGPVAGSSPRVLDVRHLQWRGIALRVESSCGSLGFWATTVSEEPGTAGCGEPKPAPTRRATFADRKPSRSRKSGDRPTA